MLFILCYACLWVILLPRTSLICWSPPLVSQWLHLYSIRWANHTLHDVVIKFYFIITFVFSSWNWNVPAFSSDPDTDTLFYGFPSVGEWENSCFSRYIIDASISPLKEWLRGNPEGKWMAGKDGGLLICKSNFVVKYIQYLMVLFYFFDSWLPLWAHAENARPHCLLHEIEEIKSTYV